MPSAAFTLTYHLFSRLKYKQHQQAYRRDKGNMARKRMRWFVHQIGENHRPWLWRQKAAPQDQEHHRFIHFYFNIAPIKQLTAAAVDFMNAACHARAFYFAPLLSSFAL
jgi:hypothetical protein